MDSIIIQLQHDVLDRNVSTSDVLRKALVVATKLNLLDFERWITNELNGYEVEVPEYRILRGQVKSKNPYRGDWIPVVFRDAELAESLCEMRCVQPIAEIEGMIQDAGPEVMFGFSYELELTIMKSARLKVPPVRVFARSGLDRIVDVVRTAILKWMLRLEKDGILGEELSFTKEEKEKVVAKSYQVNNFFGNTGPTQIAGDCAEQHMIVGGELDIIQIRSFVEELKKALPDLRLMPGHEGEMKAEIQTIEAQLSSPKPKHPTLRQSLQTVRSVLEGCAGSVLANELVRRIPTLFV
jgi:hypothetical protein